jgi:hypothetical protein
MKKIKRVCQRFRSDCGVACVAMIAGVSYQMAFDVFCFSDGEKRFYTRHKHLVAALDKLGCEVQRKWFRSWEEVPGHAILPVNHRCKRRNFHWVVFDGKAVLDPNPDRSMREMKFKRYRASGWYLLVVSRP